MRVFIAIAVAASLLAGSAFAFDPLPGQNWQRSRPPAAVAYFKLTFNAAADDAVAYGFAVTAPTLPGYGAAPVAIASMPKLLDLRFKGVVPDTLRVTEQVAWTLDPSQPSGGQRLNLFGGIGGWVLGVAGTAAAVYGIYTLVKKKCPAVSTTTGACVQPAS